MKTPITYYGDKQTLAADIVHMIPRHRIYCEPFFGGGAVFFAKEPSYLEVINDRNNTLMTFYHQVQENFEQLRVMIDTQLYSESDHAKAKDIYYNPDSYPPVVVAWAVWVVFNFSFAATPRGGWKWGNGGTGSHAAVMMQNKKRIISSALYHRLKFVQISSHDALSVIRQRDGVDTFFYLDPPYPGCDQKHYSGYTMDDFEQLLIVLGSIKGRFILSNYYSECLMSHVETNGWHYRAIQLNLAVSNLLRGRKKTEYLIWNYEIEDPLCLFTR